MGGDEAPESDNLQPAHKACHRAKTRADARHIAKAKRMRQRAQGIKRGGQKPTPRQKRMPATKEYPFGYVVDRETGEVLWPR